MEGANRASRPECFISLAGDDQRGAVISFHDARSRDPNYATVPSIAINDNAVRVTKGWITAETLLDRFQNSPLLVLAVGVELIKFGGQLAGSGGLLYAEQLNHIFGDVHSSCRVDTRRNPESHFARSRRTLRRDLSHLQQSF